MNQIINNNQTILILGFGREGQSAYRYLRNLSPETKIGIADQKPFEKFPNDIQEQFKGDQNLTLQT